MGLGEEDKNHDEGPVCGGGRRGAGPGRLVTAPLTPPTGRLDYWCSPCLCSGACDWLEDNRLYGSNMGGSLLLAGFGFCCV